MHCLLSECKIDGNVPRLDRKPLARGREDLVGSGDETTCVGIGMMLGSRGAQSFHAPTARASRR